MTININELREKITIKGLDVVADTDILAALDRLEAVEKERDALRAKIAEMEKQEPVAYLPLSSARILESGVIANAVVWNCRDKAASDMPLYALPGAQPAPSVPDGWMQHAARMAALARKLRELDWHFESIREMQRELCALEEAALAAAPEPKP